MTRRKARSVRTPAISPQVGPTHQAAQEVIDWCREISEPASYAKCTTMVHVLKRHRRFGKAVPSPAAVWDRVQRTARHYGVDVSIPLPQDVIPAELD